MKLIEFDGMEFKVADEAFLVRPIRELFEEDKTKKKERFWRQISYLWFMCDPMSSYMYLIDEGARSREVMRQEGFGEDWKPSALLEEAMDIYRRQCVTSQSLLLEDMRYGIDSIRGLIRRIGKEMSADEVDGDGSASSSLKLDKALDAMTRAVDKIPDLARKLAEAEKALAKDYVSEESARGNAIKAVGEDV